MYPITAVLTQRSGDYHISVKGRPDIWSCGKSLKKAVDAFKRTAATFQLKMESLEVNISSITEITW